MHIGELASILVWYNLLGFDSLSPWDLYSTPVISIRHVLGTGFWNGTSTLKQYFVLPRKGSKYYLKYTFLAFPILGVLGLGTSLISIVCLRILGWNR